MFEKSLRDTTPSNNRAIETIDRHCRSPKRDWTAELNKQTKNKND